MMDTTKLVVGQDVFMESGVYSCEGKVVKVTPLGVEVQTYSMGWPLQLLQFDNEGKGWDGNGTHECGPWRITMLSSELPAAFERYVREGRAAVRQLIGQELPSDDRESLADSGVRERLGLGQGLPSSKEVIDMMVRNNGRWPGAPKALQVSEYTDQSGSQKYHVAFDKAELDSFYTSPACHSLKVLWKRKQKDLTWGKP